MLSTFYQTIVFKLLKRCTQGKLVIKLKGVDYVFGNPNHHDYAEVEVLDSKLFKALILHGDIGFGESYTSGYWKSPDLVKVFKWFFINNNHLPTFTSSQFKYWIINLLQKIDFYSQNKKTRNDIIQAKENIIYHYDIGNDFFELMLDPTFSYSSALFKNEDETLVQAQINKYENLAQNLELNSNDHLLEIGSGWGGFAIYVAKKYRCQVTTITISNEQYFFVKEKIKKENLSKYINVELKDYRLLEGEFDKIVSIEMIEAIGFDELDNFTRLCTQFLKPNGLLAIQMITFNDHHFFKYIKSTNWLAKHIFPGSQLISMVEFLTSFRRFGELSLVKLDNLTASYSKTLNIWEKNIQKNKAEIRKIGFDDDFFLKWEYYLKSCEAAFSLNYIEDVQLVLRNKKDVCLHTYNFTQAGNHRETKSTSKSSIIEN